MKDSDRWDNRAKAHYHQWKSYEHESKSDDSGVLSDYHYKDLIESYKNMEKNAKKQADLCREWEKEE